MLDRGMLLRISAQSLLWLGQPQRRQQLLELLEDALEQVPADPGCTELLALWVRELGFEGLLLGDLALFLAGGLLMLGADALLRRWGGGWHSWAVSLCSAAYQLVKFRVPRQLWRTNVMLVALLGLWLWLGLAWTGAFALLVLYTSIAAWAAGGGGLC